MRQIKFYGYAAPEGTKFNANNLGYFRWLDTECGELVIKVSVEDLQIEAECAVDKFSDNYLMFLCLYCTRVAESVVNLIAFRAGAGAIVILDKFQLPGGEIKPLSWHDPKLKDICTAFTENNKLADTIRLTTQEPDLGVALTDLVQSITNPLITLINCGRVVETIRTMIAGDEERKKAWPLMHSALNVDRAYVEFISMHATDHRHGNQRPIDPAIRAEVTSRCWILMDRFLHLRLGRIDRLPEEEFPQLKG